VPELEERVPGFLCETAAGTQTDGNIIHTGRLLAEVGLRLRLSISCAVVVLRIVQMGTMPAPSGSSAIACMGWE
jgi:hypothetical protein